MKNINLEWIKTFVVFSKAPNIVEAAKELHISQPAVSLHLKNFEAAFTVAIFKQIGRKKVLTEFGNELYLMAELHLKNLENSFDQLNLKFSSVEDSTLRIGGRRELLQKILENYDFKNSIKAYELDTDKAILKLKSLDVDLVISHFRPDSSEIFSKKMFTERPMLIAHPTCMVKRQSPFSVEFLKDTPVLFYKENPPYLMDLFKKLKMDLKNIRPKLIIDNWDVIISQVEKMKGYSVVPSSFISLELEKKLNIFELPKELDHKIEIYLLYHRSARKMPALREILNQIKN